MLEIKGLYTGYGGIDVIHGIDFAVGAGEIVALVGANGAGKTTQGKSRSCRRAPACCSASPMYPKAGRSSPA